MLRWALLLLPPVAVCLERVAGRRDHAFTDPAATAQVHGDFAASSIDARHVVSVAAGSPADVAGLVLDGRAAGDFEVRR